MCLVMLRVATLHSGRTQEDKVNKSVGAGAEGGSTSTKNKELGVLCSYIGIQIQLQFYTHITLTRSIAGAVNSTNMDTLGNHF